MERKCSIGNHYWKNILFDPAFETIVIESYDYSKRLRTGLPRSDEQLESMKGSKYFTKFDLHSGFNQVRVRPEDQKSAFKYRLNTSRFVHLDYTNAATTFQQD